MSSYDAQSYGQIKLGKGSAKSGETPDDLLFDDAGPVSQVAAPSSDWDALDDSAAHQFGMADEQQVADFGNDILGETMSKSAAAPQRANKSARPQPGGSPGMGGAPVAGFAKTGPMNAAPTKAGPTKTGPTTAGPTTMGSTKGGANKAGRRPTTTALRPLPVRPMRSSRLMGTLMPPVVIACGGSAAAWFYTMEQNVVMAGIVAAVSLVGAAFTRVLFRN